MLHLYSLAIQQTYDSKSIIRVPQLTIFPLLANHLDSDSCFLHLPPHPLLYPLPNLPPPLLGRLPRTPRLAPLPRSRCPRHLLPPPTLLRHLPRSRPGRPFVYSLKCRLPSPHCHSQRPRQLHAPLHLPLVHQARLSDLLLAAGRGQHTPG
jgi:hypothetical protein